MEIEKKKKSFWGETKGLIIAVLIALAIRSLLFEPYNIPSGSMIPTLNIGDYLFATKYSYGYSKHAFPMSMPIVPHGRIFAKMPKRGDVIIFKEPHTHRDYIKRLIGLPGDTVQMIGGRLFINNKPVERTYVTTETIEDHDICGTYTRYLETLPNGVQHDIYELSDTMQYDDTPPVTVPEGYFFAMGDNRDNSLDSRYFGVVPLENLTAKARFIWYSNNGKAHFLKFWRWPESLRFNRFFQGIH